MKKKETEKPAHEDDEAIYGIACFLVLVFVVCFHLLTMDKNPPPSRWDENERSEYGAASRARSGKSKTNNSIQQVKERLKKISTPIMKQEESTGEDQTIIY